MRASQIWGDTATFKLPLKRLILVIAGVILGYLLISLYFRDHFFFNTRINGVDLSLKAHTDADSIIRKYIEEYELVIYERNGDLEIINGRDMGLQYNSENKSKLCQIQKPLQWMKSLFKEQNCYISNLYIIQEDRFDDTFHRLMCMNRASIYPKNVSFKYQDGVYQILDEVYGNVVITDRLRNTIRSKILTGEKSLNLEMAKCYASPRYTVSSDKTLQTKKLLDTYSSSSISYQLGSRNELLDGSTIHKWFSVNEDLDVVINATGLKNYIKYLSRKYDTVGIAREFQTSSGRKVIVEGGLYGWKINQEEEMKALFENIRQGAVIRREPIYSQEALSRENEIGDTYVEINITKQYLWYYKEGRVIAQGSVVTGNPNRGYGTVLGTYMLNYKERDAVLEGPGYEAKVNYWMPFYGNMGIHDALWRHSFGGEIYKRNGSHGCVNAPYHLAQKIFENIEAGIPIIIYEEKAISE